MKKFVIFIVVGLFTVVVTAFFYLTPFTFVEIINSHLPEVTITYDDGDGNIITGYKFKKISLMKNSVELLVINNLDVSFDYLPLVIGKVGVNIKSEEVKGKLVATFAGGLYGDIAISDLFFDSSSFNLNENIQFSAHLSGVLKLNGESAALEIKTDNINWSKLSVLNIEIPFTLFTSARGGIQFNKGKIIIKSINFEGPKGNARIVGEIVKNGRKLELEIIPKDWNDLFLIPLEQYKTGPGYYKLSFSM